MSAKLTHEQAHRIAALAIAADQADRDFFELEKSGARLATREARRRVDHARAALADAIAATEREAVSR